MLHPLERSLLRQTPALFQPGDRVVVGVSGGADSTALLAALRATCPLHLVAAHLDHGIRPWPERRREREAVRSLAYDLGVPFEGGEADAPAEARRRGDGSLEAAARALRYRFLGEVAARRGARRIALAHTASDQAETVLFRLLRGAGLAGAAGMPRRRRLSRAQPLVHVIRPLLDVTRSLVLDYLGARGLTWVEDSTNADTSQARSRLRLRVLPFLREQANPRVDEALLRLAAQARRADAHLRRLARQALDEAAAGEGGAGWRADVLGLKDAAVRGQALAELVARLAPGRAEARHVRALERTLRRGAGAVDLPGGTRLRLEDGRLRQDEARPDADADADALELELAVPGAVLDEAAQLRIEARILEGAPQAGVADPRRRVYLDARRARGRLTVRRRRPGDRFWPQGSPGHRTLKRFFIDQKVPRAERDRVPVVTLDGRPVWVVGHRIDEQFKVTPTTTSVLELQASSVEGHRKESVS